MLRGIPARAGLGQELRAVGIFGRPWLCSDQQDAVRCGLSLP